MMNRQQPSPLDIAADVGGTLVALSTVMFAAFPFALPLIILLTVAALPLLIFPLLVAALAAPVLLIRSALARWPRSRGRVAQGNEALLDERVEAARDVRGTMKAAGAG